MGRKETIRIVPPPYDGEIMQCATPIPQPRSARRANHRTARPALLAKIFLFSFDPNHFYIQPSRPSQRGVSRSSRTLGWDAMDADACATKRADRGRRSRVVLMPRRWHQVREDAFRVSRVMVAIKPGHQGELGVSRKTIAQGEPDLPG